MPPDPQELLPLPMATFHILLALSDQERHGYSIMREVAVRSDGEVRIGPATLYTTIKRLLGEGLIEELEERPDPDADDQRRRYYRLSTFGRQVAHAELNRLQALVRQAKSTLARG
ncbi:MAG TPA: helix-turn-helix transcriptional regulator [Bryobacteraceae bacterium]|nr:helix-turn-helix transcriptional regulator [Bryobacteraceae bacterium]